MSTVKNKMNTLGLGWLSIAFVFFLNPNISVIDLLPDFIGYLILCRGLSKIADLNESIENAVSLFRKMIFVDLGKWLAILWIFGLSAPTERNSSFLLFTFVFSVVELIVLIPAYNKLFYGITQLAYFFPNESVLDMSPKEKKKSKTDKIKQFTLVFIIAKAVFAVLPELADLTNGDYSEFSAQDSLYPYIGVMRLLAFIPVLILGIVWLFRIQHYFRRIRKDIVFVQGLEEKYRTCILPKTGMFVRRSYDLAYILIVIALVLSMDLRLESQNVLPDFLFPIAMFFAFLLLARHTALKKPLWMGCTALYFVMSIIAYAVEFRFFTNFYYGALLRSEEAQIAYVAVLLCNTVKAVLFMCLTWILVRSLYAVVLAHTGYVVGREHFSDNEKKMIGDLHRELWHTLLYAFISAVLYAISDICFDLFAPEFGFMGMINLVFGVICVAMFIKSLSAIQNAIRTKYMLE
ncbi:MAG: hypothetical protein IJY47_01360 [Clostridia bacterium]|nr:hypothetical protein [Clostridia bacterium]